MLCRNCGAQIEGNTNFCPKCGNQIKVSNEDAQNLSQNFNQGIKQGIKSYFKIGILFTVILVPIVLLIMFLSFNNGEFNYNTLFIGIFAFVIITTIVLVVLALSFRKKLDEKNQASRARFVINTRFTDDRLLENEFIKLLTQLNFYRNNNYSGNTYSCAGDTNENGLTKALFIGNTQKFLSYNIANGKIYLEAFLMLNGKELSLNEPVFMPYVKKMYIEQLKQITSYFEF